MDDGTLAMAGQSLTEHTVADAVRAAGISAPSRFVEATGSTNSDLQGMATSGAPEWTVLVAGRQHAGRGRLGRTWVAPPGSSLLVSVLLRPRIAADRTPLLSLVAAVAMAEACEAVCGIEVRCKWPNDLLAGGRKLAGILPEATFGGGRLEHVVVGTGVNVRQSTGDFPEELRASATSVVIEGGRPDMPGLLAEYLGRLRVRLADPGIVEAYQTRCATLGRTVRAGVTSGATVEGRASGIGPAGELLIDTPSGPQRVAFGEVVHLD
jgi:BirA family biotin operon repressor/biotin-[acetyl-CoA-carboxylase] ligase